LIGTLSVTTSLNVHSLRHAQPAVVRTTRSKYSNQMSCSQACTESHCGHKLRQARAAMINLVRSAARTKGIFSNAMIIHGWISERSPLRPRFPSYASALVFVCRMGTFSRIRQRQVFDAENALEPKTAYEFPWDPTEDPQQFHLVHSFHRVDCEDGTLTEDCYKRRWHPPESSVAVAPVKEHARPAPKDIVVPKGEGGGTADTELPPEETGEWPPPPPPPEKMPPTDSETGTAPRPKGDIGESPFEKSDSDGVEQERGKGEFSQPVGTPDSIKGSPPEPKKNAPPEARNGEGPEARPQSGYATAPCPSPSICFQRGSCAADWHLFCLAQA